MKYPSFSHFLAVREGLLAPDRPPAPGLPGANATGMTDAQRKRLVVKPVPNTSSGPVVRQVVPNHLIPKNLLPVTVLHPQTW